MRWDDSLETLELDSPWYGISNAGVVSWCTIGLKWIDEDGDKVGSVMGLK